jgi:NAD(P)-dependent dehydrogenase (short-subunit alcohol dehydrogenase family)
VDSRGDSEVMACDLSVWDDSWAATFAGADAVIHLAGRPSPRTSWADAQRFNIDMTMNVYEAAARHGAKRVIFASSNWVMAGHRGAEAPLTTDMEPWPINAYGVSKLAGERMGRSYHERWGLSSISFRIGYLQRGENLPGSTMGWESWGQLMWLSNRDLCHAMERAVVAEGVGAAVLNLMSDNPGMRWDIGLTRELIGYVPQDGATPVLTEAQLADEQSGLELRRMAVQLDTMVAERRW